MALADPLGRLPLSRIYVGLNDLAICRGKPNIFDAVADGTIDRIRASVRVPFGFAGLTLPEGGFPIPSRLLMSEMARLACSFVFLRRSFLADTGGVDVAPAVGRIREAVAAAFRAPDAEKAANRAEIIRAIRASDEHFRGATKSTERTCAKGENRG